MKIAHLSDLHFSHFTKNPLQLLSKTWIGNANLLLNRGKILQPLDPDILISILIKENVDLVVVTGDVTTTSQKVEFHRAKDFLHKLEKKGISFCTIPGNHDRYTKKACRKKLFYQYFNNEASFQESDHFSLKEDRLEYYNLKDCHLILLDLAKATPWFTAFGTFTEDLEKKLSELLSKIDSSKNLIICGHFPILKEKDLFHHALKNGSKLLNLLKSYPSSVFYLHGHNHYFRPLKLEEEKILQLDSGSIADIKNGSFAIIDTHNLKIIPFFRENHSIIKGASHG